jgi:DNA-binding CsgD family transcriptional regulator
VRAQLARLALEPGGELRAAFFGLTDGELELEAASPDRARVERMLKQLRFDPCDPRDPLGRVVLSNEPRYMPDLRAQSEFTIPDATLRSLYVTPVTAHGEVAGVLALGSKRPNAFSQAHRALADALGRTLGEALEVESLLADRLVHTAAYLGLRVEACDRPRAELLSRLTPRQLEVVERLRLGERPTTIAVALHISPHTVRNHLKHVYRKLGVHSQEELLRELRSPAA